MTNIAVENHHVQWENPLSMAIFHSLNYQRVKRKLEANDVGFFEHDEATSNAIEGVVLSKSGVHIHSVQ